MAVKKTAIAAVEIVDIVDRNDNVLGQMEREAALAAGKRTRIVHVLLMNDEETMLVQWRKATKSSPRTFTASAAGGVRAGESYAEAAAREMREELGIQTLPLKSMGAFQSQSQGGRKVNGELYGGVWNGEVTGWEEEADALDYINREEAEYLLKRFPYLISPSFQVSLKLFLKHSK